MRRCCSSQINPPICKQNEEPSPFFRERHQKRKVKHSQFQARGQFRHDELHLVFLEKKIPGIWCCLASAHPFANWDVTTSLHHQLCPSELGGACHVLEDVNGQQQSKTLDIVFAWIPNNQCFVKLYSRSTLPKNYHATYTNKCKLGSWFCFLVWGFLWFPCFLLGGYPYQPLKNVTRGGQSLLDTWNFQAIFTQPWRPPHCHQWGNLRWKDGDSSSWLHGWTTFW